MTREIIDHPQAQIGERTHGERNAVTREAPHQSVVLHRANAVVDPRDSKQIERFPDVARRPLLAGMGRQKEPRVAGAAEHTLELARGVPGFG